MGEAGRSPLHAGGLHYQRPDDREVRHLREVAFEWVADEVEEAVRHLGLDELGSRAGRHSWGYTEPSEAAWELLEERVSPFIEDMKRQLELGLDAEALEMCKGVVLGLYRVHNEQGDDVLQWAPNFPAETAAHAVATWRDGGDKSAPKSVEFDSA